MRRFFLVMTLLVILVSCSQSIEPPFGDSYISIVNRTGFYIQWRARRTGDPVDGLYNMASSHTVETVILTEKNTDYTIDFIFTAKSGKESRMSLDMTTTSRRTEITFSIKDNRVNHRIKHLD